MSKQFQKVKLLSCIFAIVVITLMSGCAGSSAPPQTPEPEHENEHSHGHQPPPDPEPIPLIPRAEAIPSNAIKMTPEVDTLPPQLHSNKYKEPVPLNDAINTAGAEDSAFIMPDGNTLYFWFTPDVTIPPEKQLLDGATGIYVSTKQNGQWSEVERIRLHSPYKLALDGCVFVQNNTMWFCSARQGNLKTVDIWTAEFENGQWRNWKNAGNKINLTYQVGELHITSDGNKMYFHSSRPGGKGSYDIWSIEKINDRWQNPQNVETLNTSDVEGWPFITENGQELWFTRTYMGTPGIFRSEKIDGEWSQPELIVSQFAAEPSLDSDGNLYFTHHFFKDNKMIEADIYVAYRK